MITASSSNDRPLKNGADLEGLAAGGAAGGDDDAASASPTVKPHVPPLRPAPSDFFGKNNNEEEVRRDAVMPESRWRRWKPCGEGLGAMPRKGCIRKVEKRETCLPGKRMRCNVCMCVRVCM